MPVENLLGIDLTQTTVEVNVIVENFFVRVNILKGRALGQNISHLLLKYLEILEQGVIVGVVRAISRVMILAVCADDLGEFFKLALFLFIFGLLCESLLNVLGAIFAPILAKEHVDLALLPKPLAVRVHTLVGKDDRTVRV